MDREEEIRAFKPEEYWSIDAKFIPKGAEKHFRPLFMETPDGKMKIDNKEEADKILAELEGAEYPVRKVKKGTPQKVPGSAVYHIYAAAGSFPQAGLSGTRAP